MLYGLIYVFGFLLRFICTVIVDYNFKVQLSSYFSQSLTSFVRNDGDENKEELMCCESNVYVCLKFFIAHIWCSIRGLL